MPKVSEEYRAARRDEIIGAALQLFARKGFDHTSMSDIIAESGLSAGAIYGHFTNKADLIQNTVGTLLSRRLGEFEDEVERAGTTLAPAEIIGVFLRGARAEILDLGLLVQLWAAAADNPELRAVANTIAESIRGIFHTYLVRWHLSQGQDAASAEADALGESYVCMGTCQGYMVQTAIFDDFDGDAFIEASTRVFASTASRPLRA